MLSHMTEHVHVDITFGSTSKTPQLVSYTRCRRLLFLAFTDQSLIPVVILLVFHEAKDVTVLVYRTSPMMLWSQE